MKKGVSSNASHVAAMVALLFAVSPLVCRGADTNAWQTTKLEHFVVLHRGGSVFAEKMARRAEDLLSGIMGDLGYTQHDRFWLWENRCTIRIHGDAEAFRKSTKAPGWAAGCASPARREIETFEGSDVFLEQVLPHELTHLVFREFIGFKGEIPLWLNEGVAVWESARLAGRGLPGAEGSKSVQLQNLMADDMRSVSRGAASNIYQEASAVVGFMIDRGGVEKFSTFCRQLRDGKPVDDALRFTYGPAMGNMEALVRAFNERREERRKQ